MDNIITDTNIMENICGKRKNEEKLQIVQLDQDPFELTDDQYNQIMDDFEKNV